SGAGHERAPRTRDHNRFDAWVLGRLGEVVENAGANFLLQRVDRRIVDDDDGDCAVALCADWTCHDDLLPAGLSAGTCPRNPALAARRLASRKSQKGPRNRLGPAFRIAEFRSARLTPTLGIASIAVNSDFAFRSRMARVTAYETWSTEGRRTPGATRSPGHDRKFVIALARGLDVLRAFTATEGLLGNQEIATRAGLP